jgi:hypothetical protein
MRKEKVATWKKWGNSARRVRQQHEKTMWEEHYDNPKSAMQQHEKNTATMWEDVTRCMAMIN